MPLCIGIGMFRKDDFHLVDYTNITNEEKEKYPPPRHSNIIIIDTAIDISESLCR